MSDNKTYTAACSECGKDNELRRFIAGEPRCKMCEEKAKNIYLSTGKDNNNVV